MNYQFETIRMNLHLVKKHEQTPVNELLTFLLPRKCECQMKPGIVYFATESNKTIMAYESKCWKLELPKHPLVSVCVWSLAVNPLKNSTSVYYCACSSYLHILLTSLPTDKRHQLIVLPLHGAIISLYVQVWLKHKHTVYAFNSTRWNQTTVL